MNQELSDWLDSLVSPERKQVISDTLEYLTLLHGYEIDSIAMNITNNVGRLDSYQLMDRFNSDLMAAIIEVVLRYGVTLNTDRLSLDQQSEINNILLTLVSADRYEDVDSLIDLTTDSENPESTFSEVVELLTDQDPLITGSLLAVVMPELIDQIHDRALAQKDLNSLMSGEVAKPIHRKEKELKSLVGRLGYEDGVCGYIRNNGNLTLSWNQATPLKELIMSDYEESSGTDRSHWLAAQWVCLAYLAGLFDPRIAKAAIKEALDIYINDVKTQMLVFGQVEKLINDYPME